MTTYNMSFVDTANNLYDIVYSINLTSDSLIGVLILVLVFLATYSFTKQYDTVTSMTTSSFVTSIVGGLLLFLGFTPWWFVMIPLMLLIASIIVSYFS